MSVISVSKALTMPADSSKKNYSISGFPLIFYTPETRFGFGAATILAFRFKSDSLKSKPSQIQFGFAYTQNKQILFYLPFRVYYDREHYICYGELGYYRYFYNFYGIGNGQRQDFKETYGVNFPRARLNVLKKLKNNFNAGVKYWFEHFEITAIDSTGQIFKKEIAGSKGGTTSGIGPTINFDNRDNIFYPAKGYYLEASYQYYGKSFGSNFEYSKVFIDAVKYLRMHERHIIAINLVSDNTIGNAPFNQLALLGGTKRMRGYYEGRFRDKNMLTLQAEYRTYFFWRLGGVFFGGIGEVAGRWLDYNFKNIKYSYGAGLRIALNKVEKINLRLDFAFGENTQGLYLTIGEAF